jgi:hypothetical protein
VCCADGDVQQLFEFRWRLDPLMPFDAKNAAQPASLVGEQLQQRGQLGKAMKECSVASGV